MDSQAGTQAGTGGLGLDIFQTGSQRVSDDRIRTRSSDCLKSGIQTPGNVRGRRAIDLQAGTQAGIGGLGLDLF